MVWGTVEVRQAALEIQNLAGLVFTVEMLDSLGYRVEAEGQDLDL